MNLPHCTGCTEPGSVTHQQETVEHIHDACKATAERLKAAINTVTWNHEQDSRQLTEANATIAALRALLTKDNGESGWANSRPSCLSEFCTSTTCTVDSPGEHCAWERKVEAALAQPLPPAAAKLLESANNEQAAYAERTHVVALLARVFPSGVRQTDIEGWDAEWNGCVYIDLPTGQISYHYHDSLAWLFKDLPAYTAEWDGHDKAQVWERQRATYPAAVKLLAERDAGRKLYEAVNGGYGGVRDAVEAYRKVVEDG